MKLNLFSDEWYAARNVTRDGFRSYDDDVYHCERCHRMVRTWDAVTPDQSLAILDAHTAFNCVTDPAVAITGGDRG